LEGLGIHRLLLFYFYEENNRKRGNCFIEEVFKGCVRKVALRIAKDIPDIDIKFISIASLLHDIGRFDCWKKDTIKHGLRGAEILRKEALGRYASVAERHLGAGISKEDIKEQGLKLPLNDYMPVTKEEKIITHSDNLIQGDEEISVEEAIERYKKELGKKVADKIRRLGEEVEKMKAR
jgi:uncharacterized protein (TIGR00295 family)